MIRRILFAAALVLAGIASPLHAQDGELAIAFFTTTDLAHVAELEEATRDHVGWHADQNDPWPGFVYQAMHGPIEYVWVSPGHTWADFDSPPVDPHADMMDFAERAGSAATSLDVRSWVTWTDVSRPPAADVVVPIWYVVEWDFKSTSAGIHAVRSAFAQVKEAFDAQAVAPLYTVNEVIGTDAPPQLFVSIALNSMSELDAMGEPIDVMLSETFGPAVAAQVTSAFETYLTPTASRIWTLRPDLSHMPGM